MNRKGSGSNQNAKELKGRNRKYSFHNGNILIQKPEGGKLKKNNLNAKFNTILIAQILCLSHEYRET